MGSSVRFQPPVRGAHLYSPILRTGAALVLGTDGRILAARPDLAWPLGDAPECVGRPVEELGPLCVGDTLHRLLSDSVTTGRPSAAEVGMTSPDGHNHCVSLRVAPWPSQPGLRAVTTRDTTRNYQAVEHVLAELERQRAEKTAWQHAAQAIAHDVRSPLAALRGFLSLLAQEAREKLTEREQEFLDRSLEVALRLDSLTGNLLDTADRRPPEPRACDIPEIASRLFLELRAAHPEVAFTWSISAPHRGVLVPSPILWDILWNLTENAIRYRKEDRRPHLVIRAESRGEEVQLDVEDNGRGLVAGEEERIFQRGVRGSNVENIGGHGLGLFHVRKMLGECGGRIRAARSSEGARFVLTLPATPDREEPLA